MYPCPGGRIINRYNTVHQCILLTLTRFVYIYFVCIGFFSSSRKRCNSRPEQVDEMVLSADLTSGNIWRSPQYRITPFGYPDKCWLGEISSPLSASTNQANVHKATSSQWRTSLLAKPLTSLTAT